MIPVIEELTNDIEEITYPTKTYKIDITNNRIIGTTDGLDSISQAIYLMLNTERYEYIIYSWDYGVEFIDLFGKNMSYVVSEIKRRISDALSQDDRIQKVENFNFEKNGKKLNVTFDVLTNAGKIQVEKEVEV